MERRFQFTAMLICPRDREPSPETSSYVPSLEKSRSCDQKPSPRRRPLPGRPAMVRWRAYAGRLVGRVCEIGLAGDDGALARGAARLSTIWRTRKARKIRVQSRAAVLDDQSGRSMKPPRGIRLYLANEDREGRDAPASPIDCFPTWTFGERKRNQAGSWGSRQDR